MDTDTRQRLSLNTKDIKTTMYSFLLRLIDYTKKWETLNVYNVMIIVYNIHI